MNNYLQQKPYNPHSIALRPISDHQLHPSHCNCLMCNRYPFQRQQQLLQEQEEQTLLQSKQKITKKYPQSHLQTLLKGLLLPTNKIVKRGVDIHTPPICFFEEGEPTTLYFHKDPEDPHLTKLKKDKITPSLLLKILNEQRKHYLDRLRKNLHLSLKRQQSIRKNNKHQKGIIFSKGDNLTAAVVRYHDGCETLISETELLFLLQKRKNDPAWKKITHIRNYLPPVSPNPEHYYALDLHYQHERPKYPALQQRAQQLMSTYNSKLLPPDPQYISDQEELTFCHQLNQQSQECFATYSFYKTAAFLQEFADQQITTATVKLFINELGHCFLLEAPQLTLLPLLKYNFTPEIHQKMLQQQQFTKYHKKQLTVSQKTKQKSNKIESLMQAEYEDMKQKYGVTAEPKVDLNEKLNNEFFAFLHPNLPQPLSELIKIDLPLLDFKKQILGEQQKRKSITQPFNSKLVRQLHQLTPVKHHRNALTLTAQQPHSQREHQNNRTQRHTPWSLRKHEKLSQTISH